MCGLHPLVQQEIANLPASDGTGTATSTVIQLKAGETLFGTHDRHWLHQDLDVRFDSETDDSVMVTVQTLSGSYDQKVTFYFKSNEASYRMTGTPKEGPNYSGFFDHESSTPSAHAEQIKVLLNGKRLYFDVQPQMVDDTTMVPLRAIFEALSISVGWGEKTSTVTGKKDSIVVTLQIDNKMTSINGKSVELQVPPKMISDTTMVTAALYLGKRRR